MIRNMSFDGISGKGSTIYAENCVSTNCGRFGFLANQGGDYTLYHNTFYTDGRDFSRQEPTFAYLNVRRDPITNAVLETYDIKFTFLNNIVDGINLDGEIFGDLDFSKVDSPSVVDYNLLRSTSDIYFGTGSSNIELDNITYVDKTNYNLDLDTLSPGRNKAILLSPIIPQDYCDRARDNTPDIGAYESQF